MNQSLLLATLLLCASAIHAEIFKWTDAQGQVHYSEFAPREKTAHLQKLENTVNFVTTKPSPVLRLDNPTPPHKKNRNKKPNRNASAKARQCEKLQARLDKIQRTLRAGYSEPRGNQLREQRRRLRKTYFDQCV